MDSKCFIIDNVFVLGVCNIKDNIKMGLKYFYFLQRCENLEIFYMFRTIISPSSGASAHKL